MDHHWPMRLIVFADKLEIEELRQIEIPLNCTQLPQATDGVFDLEVDFWSVESSLAFDALIIDSSIVQGIRQRAFSFRPVLFGPQPLLSRIASLHRQLELDLVEAESFEHLVSKVH